MKLRSRHVGRAQQPRFDLESRRDRTRRLEGSRIATGESAQRSSAQLANNLSIVDHLREPASMLDLWWPTIRCEMHGGFRCEKSATRVSPQRVRIWIAS